MSHGVKYNQQIMQLYSTNHQVENTTFKQAIFKGMPDDHGLYMPVKVPKLPKAFFNNLGNLGIADIGFEVSKAMIGDEIEATKLKELIADAINFEAPVKNIHTNLNALELFHGPTLAFKDFGARFMSRIMSYFLGKEDKELQILVATSGDTGGAVGHGFHQVPGISVTILYPRGKVSYLQEKQLTTLGGNVRAIEVEGTFDDCQSLVKQAFLDKEITSKLFLTSANSINISRLLPQLFYYFHAYGQVKKLGNPVVFSVPSGNFGNLCGGLLAYKMGLPVHKFVAATNVNDIVPRYLNSGQFIPKPSVQTISNAMDVGNPSNFPRMKAIFNDEYTSVKNHIVGRSFTDKDTLECIQWVYNKTNYVLDPHSAVGYMGLRDYIKKQKENLTGVFLCTAHPSKFIGTVEMAIGRKIEIPERLAKLRSKEKITTLMSPVFQDFKEFLLS